MNGLTQRKNVPLLKSRTDIPLIMLQGMSIFPGMVLHFDLKRNDSIEAVNESLTNYNRQIFLTELKIESLESNQREFYNFGCFAVIKQAISTDNENLRVLVEVKERGQISKLVNIEPYKSVIAKKIIPTHEKDQEALILKKLVTNSFNDYLKLTNIDPKSLNSSIEIVSSPEALVDMIASNLDLDTERAQVLLSEQDTRIRLSNLYHYLMEEIEFIKIEQSIDEKVHDELDKNQREYVLREQIRIIQEELGEGEEDRVNNYLEKLDHAKLPQVVVNKVNDELEKLKKMPPGSSESGIIETYLDLIFALPWNKQDTLNSNIKRARSILNREHYGLETVKERILEYLSVLKLTNSLKSPILCLVGPPGVGKTSIAKSIANATGRKYIRISLGGIRDEAEIRGHRRTYLGSIPGRIIYHLKMCGSRNPLFLLDEIDKIGQDLKGDPTSALLEVLDPEQNNSFTDNYLELPFDLSQILFITTANTINNIPEPLLDRMEVIEVNGYIEDEKYHIAKKYLIPELLKEHGLTSKQLTFSRPAIFDIITFYTRESGVRELKRLLAKICRIAAKEIVEDKKEKVSIARYNVETYLGNRKYDVEKISEEAEAGLVNGLAWTSAGGETLEIETNYYPGVGKLKLTGQLGDVMQESAQAAMSFIKSRAEKYNISPIFFNQYDIHVHVPEGAVPKDGPSAGITITTALLSAIINKPVRSNLAMTGEITLRGRVLPIGGLREKLAAASRAGITEVIYPEANKKDLEEIPDELFKNLTLYPVKNYDEVYELTLGKDK